MDRIPTRAGTLSSPVHSRNRRLRDAALAASAKTLTVLAALLAAFFLDAISQTGIPGLGALFYVPAIFVAAAFGGAPGGAAVCVVSLAGVLSLSADRDAGLAAAAALAVVGAFEIVALRRLYRPSQLSGRTEARRLQAVAGGPKDRIFLSGSDGRSLALLSEHGWAAARPLEWLDTVHPDDRSMWPTGQGMKTTQLLNLRVRTTDGGWRWHRLRAVPLPDDNGTVREWIGTLRDIHNERQTSERQNILIGELRHRLKNLVTVIAALARNSRKRSDIEPGVDSFLQRFLGRLHALGAAGDLILAGNRTTIEAGALIRATLEPFIGDNAHRIRLSGPEILLSQDMGVGLGLALHELATNALKHGALSVPDGALNLTWSVTRAESGEEVAFVWTERGGPPPKPPDRSGFGTRMLKSVLAREKNGRVDLAYPAEGFTCRMSFTSRENRPADRAMASDGTR